MRVIKLRLLLDANLLEDRRQGLAELVARLFRVPNVHNAKAGLPLPRGMDQKPRDWPIGRRPIRLLPSVSLRTVSSYLSWVKLGP